MIQLKYWKDGIEIHKNTRLDGCDDCGGWEAETPAHLCPLCYTTFGVVAKKYFDFEGDQDASKASTRLETLIELLSEEDYENLE